MRDHVPHWVIEASRESKGRVEFLDASGRPRRYENGRAVKIPADELPNLRKSLQRKGTTAPVAAAKASGPATVTSGSGTKKKSDKKADPEMEAASQKDIADARKKANSMPVEALNAQNEKSGVAPTGSAAAAKSTFMQTKIGMAIRHLTRGTVGYAVGAGLVSVAAIGYAALKGVSVPEPKETDSKGPLTASVIRDSTYLPQVKAEESIEMTVEVDHNMRRIDPSDSGIDASVDAITGVTGDNFETNNKGSGVAIDILNFPKTSDGERQRQDINDAVAAAKRLIPGLSGTKIEFRSNKDYTEGDSLDSLALKMAHNRTGAWVTDLSESTQNEKGEWYVVRPAMSSATVSLNTKATREQILQATLDAAMILRTDLSDDTSSFNLYRRTRRWGTKSDGDRRLGDLDVSGSQFKESITGMTRSVREQFPNMSLSMGLAKMISGRDRFIRSDPELATYVLRKLRSPVGLVNRLNPGSDETGGRIGDN